jgi:SAM-dependent methyltransferase
VSALAKGKKNAAALLELLSVPAVVAARAARAGVESLVDVGCGDCSTTSMLRERLGLPRSRVLGLEYEASPPDRGAAAQPQSMGCLRGADGCVYGLYPGNHFALRVPARAEVLIAPDAPHMEDLGEPDEALAKRDGGAPYPLRICDGAVDVITLVHVLHHVPATARAELLRAAACALRADGGLLIIKDHDCPSPAFGRFLDAVHVFKQRVVYAAEREYMPFSDYQAAESLIAQAAQAGLRLLHRADEPGAHLRDVFLVFARADKGAEAAAACT